MRFSAQRGFSLLEVLVTLVVLIIGILDLFKLQVVSSASITENNKRQIASSLLADLVEAMRSDSGLWLSNGSSPSFRATPPFLASSSASASLCGQGSSRDEWAKNYHACWRAQVKSELHLSDSLMGKVFICRSQDGVTCSATGALVMAQIAWPSRDCRSQTEDEDGEYCVDSTKNSGVELYRLAFQP